MPLSNKTKHQQQPPTAMLQQRPSKRSRRGVDGKAAGSSFGVDPLASSWMDCETVAAIPSPQGMLVAPVVSDVTKEVFLERLQKEILGPYQFSLSSQMRLDDPKEEDGQDGPEEEDVGAKRMSLADHKERRRQLQTRIRVGVNACTRLLEHCLDGESTTKPVLAVVTAEVEPAAALAHLVVLLRAAKVPLLLLPGSLTSNDLGRLLGTKRVACMLFTQHTQNGNRKQDWHVSVDSFVQFILGKLES